MASIFKRGGRKGKGGYFIGYSERPGLRKTVYAGRDLAAAQALARKLEADAMLRREGVIDPKADAYGAAETKPLRAHLADFAKALRDRGNTEKHVALTQGHVDRVLTAANVDRISELSPSRVRDALATLRKEGRGLTTCNHALRAAKSFSKWLVRDGRAGEDTLAYMAAFNTATDVRHKRRALSEAELALLVSATEAGPVRFHLSGRDRAALYCLAVETGLRANELRSLTPESFALDAEPPFVLVAAGYSKRRRRDEQPIRPDLAARLGVWLVGKQEGIPVFGELTAHTADMLRADLAAAGVAEETAEGVADFHALRHTFVSRLVRSGVNVKIAQELARHSTPVLTLGRYTHVDMQDKVLALATVPTLDAPTSTARGTAHARHGGPCRALPQGHDGRETGVDDSGIGLRIRSRIGDLAEREGFEPSEEVIPLQRISNPLL
jgi:integrase